MTKTLFILGILFARVAPGACGDKYSQPLDLTPKEWAFIQQTYADFWSLDRFRMRRMHEYLGNSPHALAHKLNSLKALKDGLTKEGLEEIHENLSSRYFSRIEIKALLEHLLPNVDDSTLRRLAHHLSSSYSGLHRPEDWFSLYTNLGILDSELRQEAMAKRRQGLWTYAMARNVVSNPANFEAVRGYLKTLCLEPRLSHSVSAFQYDVGLHLRFSEDKEKEVLPPYLFLPKLKLIKNDRKAIAGLLVQKFREAITSSRFREMKTNWNITSADVISRLVRDLLDTPVRRAYQSTISTEDQLSLIYNGISTVQGLPFGIPFSGELSQLQSPHAPHSSFGKNVLQALVERNLRIWRIGESVRSAFGIPANKPAADVVALDDERNLHIIELKESIAGRNGGTPGADADLGHARHQIGNVAQYGLQKGPASAFGYVALTLESRLPEGYGEQYDSQRNAFVLFNGSGPIMVGSNPVEVIRVSAE